MYVFVCVCVHMWRSEVNLLQWLATLFFGAESLTDLEFTVSPRLTGQQAPRICMSLPLQF